MQTRIQFSAGGVVYRRVGEKVQVALVGKGEPRVWALPKGLIEKREAPEAAAAREAAEETGLQVRLVGKIDDIEYWYVDKGENCRYHKKVYHFLFEATGGDIAGHDWEYDVAAWYNIDEAPNVMSYANEAKIVKKAKEMLG